MLLSREVYKGFFKVLLLCVQIKCKYFSARILEILTVKAHLNITATVLHKCHVKWVDFEQKWAGIREKGSKNFFVFIHSLSAQTLTAMSVFHFHLGMHQVQ